MKVIRVVNGQVITEETVNGIQRITSVEPYHKWEEKLHQQTWWEKAVETIKTIL